MEVPPRPHPENPSRRTLYLTQLLRDTVKLVRQERIPEFNIRAAEGFVFEMKNRIVGLQEYHDASVMQFATEVANFVHYTVQLYSLLRQRKQR